eukprot:6906565-Alexandrium_andersonii.AAC.1
MARTAGGASLGRALSRRRPTRMAVSNWPGTARRLRPSTPSSAMEASGATKTAGLPSRARGSSCTMA